MDVITRTGFEIRIACRTGILPMGGRFLYYVQIPWSDAVCEGVLENFASIAITASTTTNDHYTAKISPPRLFFILSLSSSIRVSE
jgi:hypothetical protein